MQGKATGGRGTQCCLHLLASAPAGEGAGRAGQQSQCQPSWSFPPHTHAKRWQRPPTHSPEEGRGPGAEGTHASPLPGSHGGHIPSACVGGSVWSTPSPAALPPFSAPDTRQLGMKQRDRHTTAWSGAAGASRLPGDTHAAQGQPQPQHQLRHRPVPPGSLTPPALQMLPKKTQTPASSGSGALPADTAEPARGDDRAAVIISFSERENVC